MHDNVPVHELREGITMAVNPGDVLPCETFLSMYSTAMSSVRKLINIPRKYLRKLQDMMSYPFDRVTDVLTSVSNMLDDLDFNVGAMDFLRGLEKLISCPLIADSAMGAMAAQTIDMIKNGIVLPMDGIINSIKREMRDRVNNILSKYRPLVDNSINSMAQKYTAVLDSCGLTDTLKTLGQLQSCISDLCSSYTLGRNMAGKTAGYIPDDIPYPMKACGVSWDKATNKIEMIKDDAFTAAREKCDDIGKKFLELEKLCKDKLG